MSQAASQLPRIFSGIQPTGTPHLGNYFGALVQWCQLAKDRSFPTKSPDKGGNLHTVIISCEKPIYSIVDVHAYTSPRCQFGAPLYEQILSTTASLLALGLNNQNCILTRQSDILEHNYLDNVFHNFVSTQRLAHMTQFKEKIASLSSKYDQHKTQMDFAETFGKNSKSVPNGLLTYPILQAADILLYRANFVPVGEDQVQHLELARDVARNFNHKTGSSLFPEPKVLLNRSSHARRLKSLRDPTKKMSKSEPDKKSFIEITDEPEVIVEKFKKAVTDSISKVYYEPETRPGISNLMRIHHLTTGSSFDDIQQELENVESAKYKLMLADIVIEHLKPVRLEYNRIRSDRQFLESVLSAGRREAQPMAQETIQRVRHLLGSIRLSEDSAQ